MLLPSAPSLSSLPAFKEWSKTPRKQLVAEYETVFVSDPKRSTVDHFTIPDLVNVLAMEYKERLLAWVNDMLKADGLSDEQKEEMFEQVESSLGRSDRQTFWAISQYNNRLIKDRRADNRALVKKIKQQDAFDKQLLLELEAEMERSSESEEE